ncbi:MAG TPA: glycosyltransferase family 2 protein [Geminicoccaceae bacterium]|jgi:dolichol-phosphate mannosyltransferase|nr:glycosyltransferase family 2 protein [Geminicoccaceae bacterium]
MLVADSGDPLASGISGFLVSCSLAIIVPTLNEAGNIRPLLDRLEAALSGIAYEVIFVDDDSSDGTPEIIRRATRECPNVRCLRRIGRRGLASACIEGMLATGAPCLAIMDADLQHDEAVLRRMYEILAADPRIDLVVASRFAHGASCGALSHGRACLSRIGNALTRAVVRAELSDPLSGFFALRRELLEEVVHSLSGQGFKILLDILASSRRRPALIELPLTFRERHSGQSKLDLLVALEFAMLLADKTLGRLVPVRFVLFVLVGLFGLLVHLAFLAAALKAGELPFYWAQAVATWSAMTVNFYLNNKVTYRDRQLRGGAFARGLVSFYLACAIGAVINLQIAELIYEHGAIWPIAGALGAIVGSVWNYGITSTFTWRSTPRPAHA